MTAKARGHRVNPPPHPFGPERRIVFQAWNPPIRSVARSMPSWRSHAAARLELYVADDDHAQVCTVCLGNVVWAGGVQPPLQDVAVDGVCSPKCGNNDGGFTAGALLTGLIADLWASPLRLAWPPSPRLSPWRRPSHVRDLLSLRDQLLIAASSRRRSRGRPAVSTEASARYYRGYGRLVTDRNDSNGFRASAAPTTKTAVAR